MVAENARNRHIILSIELTDDDDVTLELRNGVLIDPDGVDPDAYLLISMDRETFNEIALSGRGFEEAAGRDDVDLTGNNETYREFWNFFDNEIFADRIAVR